MATLDDKINTLIKIREKEQQKTSKLEKTSYATTTGTTIGLPSTFIHNNQPTIKTSIQFADGTNLSAPTEKIAYTLESWLQLPLFMTAGALSIHNTYTSTKRKWIPQTIHNALMLIAELMPLATNKVENTNQVLNITKTTETTSYAIQNTIAVTDLIIQAGIMYKNIKQGLKKQIETNYNEGMTLLFNEPIPDFKPSTTGGPSPEANTFMLNLGDLIFNKYFTGASISYETPIYKKFSENLTEEAEKGYIKLFNNIYKFSNKLIKEQDKKKSSLKIILSGLKKTIQSLKLETTHVYSDETFKEDIDEIEGYYNNLNRLISGLTDDDSLLNDGGKKDLESKCNEIIKRYNDGIKPIISLYNNERLIKLGDESIKKIKNKEYELAFIPLNYSKVFKEKRSKRIYNQIIKDIQSKGITENKSKKIIEQLLKYQVGRW